MLEYFPDDVVEVSVQKKGKDGCKGDCDGKGKGEIVLNEGG